MAEKGNPILEVYKGRLVRKYNKIYLRVSAEELKKFIDAKEDLGISERQLLEYSTSACVCCKGLDITLYNKEKTKSLTIKKKVLCKKQ